ncbi:hypothetical protein TPY_2646 [Sulfobacillus acidophilus TPY]|uniref:Uncharacterized protein n=1 Tax=Sulfobacillus acidophilus (strain ATCC 700253 / DSM 10332 / NAL) TaxID=679936 RepID=G8TV94_SULAD|nr:hypothetical protein TPY_2646 [Sulfobacillus acidophilus TPY]AEW04734.1 hypothetical protein Sulac_1234 [Sulfobacillus acidophilus DSM 10332]
MHLAPPQVPTTNDPRLQRPPLYVPVRLHHPLRGAQETWTTMIRLRLPTEDLLAAPLTWPQNTPWPDGDTVLTWHHQGQALQYPVHLTTASGAINYWRIRYRGPAEIINERQEWRNTEWTLWGRIWPLTDVQLAHTTRSYDFSPSAIRLWLNTMTTPDTLWGVEWRLDDNAKITGTMRVIRQETQSTTWRYQRGWITVMRWEQFGPAHDQAWRLFCWKHQPKIL